MADTEAAIAGLARAIDKGMLGGYVCELPTEMVSERTLAAIQADQAASRAIVAALDGGLNAAWAEATAALPEGWTGPFVGPHVDGDFWANAWLTYGASHGRKGQQQDADNIIVAQREAHGPTPVAALLALVAALDQPEPNP